MAGELMVTTVTPVVIKIDGAPIDFVPGTMMAQVSNLRGVHRVEITSVTGARQAQMNVNVPAQGAAALIFDGANLTMAQAGVGGPGVGMPIARPPAMRPPVARPPVAQPPAATGPVPIAPSAFARLVSTVSNASFSDDKLNAIRAAAGGNYFTVAQVGQLVDEISFSKDQVEAVRILRPRIVDPGNGFALADHFSFSSDREKVMAMFQ